MCFFELNFLNVRDILAQKIYIACTFFNHFSDVKNKGRSQQPSILGHLAKMSGLNSELSFSDKFYDSIVLLGRPITNGISCFRFQWKKSSFFHQNINNTFARRNSLNCLIISITVCVYHCLCPMFLFLLKPQA